MTLEQSLGSTLSQLRTRYTKERHAIFRLENPILPHITGTTIIPGSRLTIGFACAQTRILADCAIQSQIGTRSLNPAHEYYGIMGILHTGELSITICALDLWQTAKIGRSIDCSRKTPANEVGSTRFRAIISHYTSGMAFVHC